MKDKIAIAKARLDVLSAKKDSSIKAPKEKEGKHTQQLLWTAIETASSCTSILPAERLRIEELVRNIEANKAEDEHWETRVNYHLQNLYTLEKTYPMFEDEAKRRKDLILEVNRRGRWQQEKDKCQEDTMYWFDNYAWTADPRKTGIWSLPFMLYDFQREAVDWLENLIFLKQSSGIVEKSRDLGLSWLITSFLYKHWQHPRDGAFSALMGSITSDECDKIGDPSSMFEKLRIQGRLQPLGLLPKGWDCNISYMKAVNPENGSTLTGETSNADFGRSGRYKVIVFDEFSAFEQDTAAMTASSQSSPCKIYNSTARGMNNEFFRLATGGTIEKRTYRWQMHPYKTQDWYEYQKLEMSPVQVAQELDIDYSASTPNKVYAYDEVYHVVTKSEVMRALPHFRRSDGQFHIPFGNRIMMGYDVGQSEEHANAILWTTTLKDGTKTVDGIDLSGCVLVHREVIAPPHSTPRNIAAIVRDAEGAFECRMVDRRVMSHEQTTMRDSLDWDYNLPFEKWNSDYNAGISRVRDYLQVINKHQPHPFRDYSRKVMFENSPPIMGRPSMFLVVDDGQGELVYDESFNRYRTVPPADNGGLIRTRMEFLAYHFPSTEIGKEVTKMRPKKVFDDAMDCLRCIASECFAPISPMTDEERFEKHLPDSLKPANIEKLPSPEQGMAVLMFQEEKRKFEKEQQQIGLSYRDRLWLEMTGK